jgi:cytochrome o ubiquinol oxidase operon protein cyoD
MHDQLVNRPDFGTGKKTLKLYVTGLIFCIILTLISFATVKIPGLPQREVLAIIYTSAIIQFLVQVIYFLRLYTQTKQGQINIMSFVFTGVILLCIVIGSLWIMSNMHHNLMLPHAG